MPIREFPELVGLIHEQPASKLNRLVASAAKVVQFRAVPVANLGTIKNIKMTNRHAACSYKRLTCQPLPLLALTQVAVTIIFAPGLLRSLTDLPAL
jgi:hypothetical protein